VDAGAELGLRGGGRQPQQQERGDGAKAHSDGL
jgi:hypothetical protein